jgi:hypothetical protein
MLETYSVVGYWADSNERACEHTDATSARDAENRMLERALQEDGNFRIAGTLLGEHQVCDTYTAFVDPDDPANDDRTDLEPAIDELTVMEWTVFGLILGDDNFAWNEKTAGERYLGRQMALNARIAEDLAVAEVRDRGGVDLLVCAVFQGVKNRCETFPFAKHDVTVEA